MNIEDVFKAKARKYNEYMESGWELDRNCMNCIRWRFSYPYTCKSFDARTQKKARTCLNYSEDKNALVD